MFFLGCRELPIVSGCLSWCESVSAGSEQIPFDAIQVNTALHRVIIKHTEVLCSIYTTRGVYLVQLIFFSIETKSSARCQGFQQLLFFCILHTCEERSCQWFSHGQCIALPAFLARAVYTVCIMCTVLRFFKDLIGQ